MNLMSGSTTYSALNRKYSGMSAPSVRVIVDGTDLVNRLKCTITDVAVELTTGFEASGCTFTVTGEYEIEKSKFRSRGAVKYLQIGAKVEVNLGYMKRENVFYGYILEVEYVWSQHNGPEIRVTCADAKCLMMKSQRMEILNDTKLTQAVNDILGQRPASAYMKGKEVDRLKLEGEIFRLPLESDYDFLLRYAEYTGCEFFIIQGKAYFREQPASGAPIMTISLRKGLLAAKVSQRGGKLVKEVEVAGIDPENGKGISGNARAKGSFSQGASANKTISNTTRSYFDENITSAREATARAKIIMEALQKDFMVIRAKCVGIPEIVPGRFIKLQGLAPNVNKTWYIQSVRHTVDERGFTTEFEARVDSL